MQLEIAFYPTDITIRENSAILFGYTKDNKRIAVIDESYRPYFFVHSSKLDLLAALCKEHNVKLEHYELAGDLAKVYALPSSMPIINALAQKEGIKHWNLDLPLRRRYWCNKNIIPLSLCKVTGEAIAKDLHADIIISAETIDCLGSPMQEPNIVAIDIETTSERGRPNPKEDAIIMAAIYSNGLKRVLTWKKFAKAPDYVEFVDSESALIDEFVKILYDSKPHIIVGYGSDNFDWPYLIERAKKYGRNMHLNWDKSEFGSEKGGKKARIIGPTCIDISRFIRAILDLDTDQYKLDIIAKKLLGRGKRAALSAKRINEMWSVGLPEELSLLTEYNLVDAELAHELCKKVLPIELELAKLCCLPLQDINSATYSLLVEWFLIKNSDQPIPTRPNTREVFERMKQSYRGGLVVEPIPGMHKPILSFDFRSLYPTIIASHNISPETMGCSCCGNRGFAVPELKLWFCNQKEGFIPSIVKDLVERRKRINEILRQTNPTDASFSELMARQHALKYVAAASYGYLGYAGSRYYCFDCARAVTSLGRKYIQLVIKEAEKFGFKVLYGDTDGIFVQPLNKDTDAKTFLHIINSILPPPMELEFKSSYKAGLFLEKKTGVGGAKKRYALLTEADNLILRGLEAIRGDWSPIAKRTQKEILHILLTENDVEKAAIHLKTVLSALKQRKINVSDLVISSRLSRDVNSYAVSSPRVTAAKLAARKGYRVGRGSILSYVITMGDGRISDRIALAEDAKLEDYDIEYYVDNQVLRAVYKIFETFGYDLEKLKEGQTTIGGYGS